MSEIASFLITFRETLEAALIIGIVLAYLARVGQSKYNNFVYLGAGAGIVGSVIAAILFNSFAGGFEGATEQIFEGVTMIVGALLITFMILWLMNQKRIVKELEGKVQRELTEAHRFGLFFLVFVSVLREGIETVLFLGATSFIGEGGYSIFGAIGGIAAAIVLGYLIFAEMMRINIKKVFLITGILLILFAAGLVAHGVHELQEASVLPIFVEHVWDVNPLQNPDGSYPLLHEKGAIGSIVKGLFGYNGDPSLIEILSYAAYVLIILIAYRKIGSSKGGRLNGEKKDN